MMSAADNTAKRACDAMVVEHAKGAKYVCPGDLHKYRLKHTAWVEQHQKGVLSLHRQQ